MFLILILSSSFTVQALQPNVYFEFNNSTKSENFTKVSYSINNYERSSLPFDINYHFDMSMEYKISKKDYIDYASTILFKSKDGGELVQKQLMSSRGEADPSISRLTSDGNLNFKRVLFFESTEVIKKIIKCNLEKGEILGKFYIINFYNDSQDLRVNGKILTPKFDAYFEIFQEKKKLTCESGTNFKFIFVVSGFLILLCFIILFEVFNFATKIIKKKSSTVHVEELTSVFHWMTKSLVKVQIFNYFARFLGEKRKSLNLGFVFVSYKGF